MNNEELEKLLRKIVQEENEPLKQGQARLETIIEALKAGQDDIRDKMATEANVMDMAAKLNQITRNHERRIEELENLAGLPNPHKN